MIDKAKALETKENPTIGDVIYFFHVGCLNQPAPDNTHYAAGTKMVSGLVKKNKEYPEARIYSTNDLIKALVEMRARGVFTDATYSITILSFPDLVRCIVDNDTLSLARIVNWLMANKPKGDSVIQSMPSGW